MIYLDSDERTRFTGGTSVARVETRVPRVEPRVLVFKEVESNDTCSICLVDFKSDAVSLECNHVFHIECITEWIKSRRNCPVCRREV